MSPQDLTDANRGVVVQKPKADIYTWLLLVALVAILMAITCLALELKRYDWDFKAAGAGAVAMDVRGPLSVVRG
ncbi:MAG TPA: hypothetical protein VNH11_05075 [Pirellulales bacterium]|nr:hypothetical protein [Pirellulales bacterium]